MRVVVVLILLGCVQAAQATDLEREVLRCGSMEDNLRRLTCFDKVARLLNAGIRIEDLSDDDDKVITDEARARFGKRGVDNYTELEAVVSRVDKLPRNRFQVTLGDGQIWREIEGDSRTTYRPGDQILITRGIMGTYDLRNKRTGVRNKVRRIE